MRIEGKRRIAGVLTVAVIATAVVLAALAGSASGEVWTCGKAGPYQAGYGQAYGTGAWVGSQVDIRVEYGAVCDTVTTGCNPSSNCNFTASWDMIAGVSIYGGYGWGQSGFMRWYNSCSYNAAQYERSTGLGTQPVSTWGSTCLTYGNTNTYQNTQIDSCGCMNDNVNGSKLEGTTWDPKNEWVNDGSHAFSPQFFAEAKYLESDIPGDSTNYTHYTNLEGKKLSNNSWVSYPCSSLTKSNDGSATRADGESWHVVAGTTCPNFKTYTG